MTAHDTGHSWRAPAHLAVALLLCAVAAVLRFGPLGPSSLWLDDAWVALVSKTQSVSDTFTVGLTGPGFAFALKGWLALAGFSETAAQLPAFVLGVAAPGALYLVAVARGFSFAGALTAAGLLVASPVHVVYSTRVKHYTLDAVLAIALIGLAWWLIDQPTPRRWLWLTVVACAAVVMSGGVVPVVAAALGASALASLSRGRRMVMVAVGACAAWALFALAWYAAVLRPAITPAIRGYWADRYVGSAGELLNGMASLLAGFSGLPHVVSGVLVVAAAVSVLSRRPRVALLLLLPLAGLIGLAIAGLAPLGGGRTDVFVYPALSLLIGGLVEHVRSWRPRAGLVGAATVTVAALLAGGFAPPYPAEDVRPLVAEVQRRRQPGETLLVYPSTVWAYALYTDQPVTIRPSDNPWGFEPVVNDADVILLQAHRDNPERYAADVQAATPSPEPVWLLSSHHRKDLRVIHRALRQQGRTIVGEWRRAGAALVSWSRR